MLKLVETFNITAKEAGYEDYTPTDWAMMFITQFGQVDGAHHKAWVLDQVARILHGADVTIRKNVFNDGRFNLTFEVGSSESYEEWAKEMLGDKIDGEYEYTYDAGIAP